MDPLHDRRWLARHPRARWLDQVLAIHGFALLALTALFTAGLIAVVTGSLDENLAVWGLAPVLPVGLAVYPLRALRRRYDPIEIVLGRHQLRIGEQVVSVDRIARVDDDLTVHTPDGTFGLPSGYAAPPNALTALRARSSDAPAPDPPAALDHLRRPN